MPDEKGNFVPGGVALRGKGGTLKHGHRYVSDLGSWTATIKEVAADDSSVTLQISVKNHDADPFWLEHAPARGLRLELMLGRREMSGAAALLSRAPLIIEATLEVR